MPGGRGKLALIAATLMATGVVAGCSSPLSTATRQKSATSAPSGAADSGTVWLCRPAQADDPCTASLTTTVVSAVGRRTVVHPTAASNPPIDCFYVYPTVSRQTTANANLHIDPEETAVATIQASRFSQVCRVYAPMYPQLTRTAIGVGGRAIDPHAAAVAYLGVLSAWKDYLAHDNHGRGVVLIGHSQGASILIALLRSEIDGNAAERRLLVSALLMGGNVTVPAGQVVGGDFQHIPACTSSGQTGCVVAYSSFESPPPDDSFFGRVGTAIGASLTQPGGGGGDLQVLCTNPAALAGGSAALDPYFVTPAARVGGGAGTPADVTTPWIAYPGRYTATCSTSGGATWLQIDPVPDPPDHRPAVSQTLGPRWGLHLVDVNLALGNLVQLVQHQANAFTHTS